MSVTYSLLLSGFDVRNTQNYKYLTTTSQLCFLQHHMQTQ